MVKGVDLESVQKGLNSLDKAIEAFKGIIPNNSSTPLKDVYEPQKKTIERIYLLIERLYNSLISMPIDVAAVNRYANEMVSLNTGLKEFVNTVIAQATEVENNVLSANKIRSEVGSFDVALCEAEKDFFKGNFSQANQNALSVIQKPKR